MCTPNRANHCLHLRIAQKGQQARIMPVMHRLGKIGKTMLPRQRFQQSFRQTIHLAHRMQTLLFRIVKSHLSLLAAQAFCGGGSRNHPARQIQIIIRLCALQFAIHLLKQITITRHKKQAFYRLAPQPLIQSLGKHTERRSQHIPAITKIKILRHRFCCERCMGLLIRLLALLY
ncbi:MAG: hypothetical protein R3E89_01290 [Thiolinea sp.]